MPTCPQCNQSIVFDAVTCSNCGLELKAHGHPGIDLYRSQSGSYLCETCVYHQDDSCTFPQRPQAVTCTLYVNIAQEPESAASKIYTIPWWRKYSGWLLLAALILISVALVVF